MTPLAVTVACWWCGNEADAELTRDLDVWVCAEPEACYARGSKKRGWTARTW